MAPGAELFKEKEVPFEMKIHGYVNGKEFTIYGKGAGDARIGKLKGKWVSIHNSAKPDVKVSKKVTASPPCPMAWGVLAPTFAYGMKVYAKYPEKTPDGEDFGQYFQDCMPLGYTQRRLTRFGRLCGNDDPEEEGIMKTYHEVTVREGQVMGQLQWIVHSRVHLDATFKEGSPLLQNDSTELYLQSLERTVPFEDGVKNYVQYFYPIKDSPIGDMIIATQMTHNRPHCGHCSHKFLSERYEHNQSHNCGHRVAPKIPPPHFKRTEAKQWLEEGEKRDHRLQDEINQHFYFKHDEPWTQIGEPDVLELETKVGEVKLGEYRKDI